MRLHRRVRGSFVLRRLVNASPVPLLEPIAGQVAGDRYADMSLTSAAREA